MFAKAGHTLLWQLCVCVFFLRLFSVKTCSEIRPRGVCFQNVLCYHPGCYFTAPWTGKYVAFKRYYEDQIG